MPADYSASKVTVKIFAFCFFFNRSPPKKNFFKPNRKLSKSTLIPFVSSLFNYCLNGTFNSFFYFQFWFTYSHDDGVRVLAIQKCGPGSIPLRVVQFSSLLKNQHSNSILTRREEVSKFYPKQLRSKIYVRLLRKIIQKVFQTCKFKKKFQRF